MPEAASPAPLPRGQGVWTAPNVSAKTERTLLSKEMQTGRWGKPLFNSGQFSAVLFMAVDREGTLFICT